MNGSSSVRNDPGSQVEPVGSGKAVAAAQGGPGAVVVRSGDYVVQLSGHGEYTVPAGVYQLDVLVVGGGGGAGSAGGGGRGKTRTATLDVSPGDRFAFAVGAGGGAGQDGGDSYFIPTPPDAALSPPPAAEVSKSTYKIQVNFGSVRMGEPTGHWVRRGEWWYQTYTDTVWLDEYGRERRREPREDIVGISQPYNMRTFEPIEVPPARKGWFWSLLGMERELPEAL